MKTLTVRTGSNRELGPNHVVTVNNAGAAHREIDSRFVKTQDNYATVSDGNTTVGVDNNMTIAAIDRLLNLYFGGNN